MPKKQLTEEEKYKADVRKKSSHEFSSMSSKEQTKLLDQMWEREDKKRIKQFEETLGKNRGLKRKETKEIEGIEKMGPGLFRDIEPPTGKPRVRKIFNEKVKLRWI